MKAQAIGKGTGGKGSGSRNAPAKPTPKAARPVAKPKPGAKPPAAKPVIPPVAKAAPKPAAKAVAKPAVPETVASRSGAKSVQKPVAKPAVTAAPKPVAVTPKPAVSKPTPAKPAAAKPVAPQHSAPIQAAPRPPVPKAAAAAAKPVAPPAKAPPPKPAAASRAAEAGRAAPSMTRSDLPPLAPPVAAKPAPSGLAEVQASAPLPAPVPPVHAHGMSARRDGPHSPPPRQPSKHVEFKAGDHVVYPTHGVGTVQGIESMSAAGHTLQVIVVTFDENRMTLRVPVGKASSSGLRKLASEEAMKEALDTLKGRARIKRTMWSRRAQEYEAKINSGDPVAIAEVVRDLHRNAGQPDQSFSERQIYEQAMDRLAAELAAIDRTDKAGATEKLLQHLKAA
ncbi:CarD family transcriptional regulator [Dankookia sp. GCM10030260]|uniref:CarD family transcriptional regulator n=2 Tax=unclassified Dankookia TaxID=2630042 RepID=UPI00360D5558